MVYYICHCPFLLTIPRRRFCCGSLSLSLSLFTDHSKAVLLLWLIIIVIIRFYRPFQGGAFVAVYYICHCPFLLTIPRRRFCCGSSSLSLSLFTDHSKAVLLLWLIIIVIIRFYRPFQGGAFVVAHYYCHCPFSPTIPRRGFCCGSLLLSLSVFTDHSKAGLLLWLIIIVIVRFYRPFQGGAFVVAYYYCHCTFLPTIPRRCFCCVSLLLSLSVFTDHSKAGLLLWLIIIVIVRFYRPFQGGAFVVSHYYCHCPFLLTIPRRCFCCGLLLLSLSVFTDHSKAVLLLWLIIIVRCY